MLTLLLTFTLLLCLSLAKPEWYQLDQYTFEQYCNDFQKSYTPQEAKTRKQIFETRIRENKRHNSNPSKTWKVGVNKFTDQTTDEMNAVLGGKVSLPSQKRVDVKALKEVKGMEFVAPSIDWRTKGVISPVKDQGKCGSCWAFAAAETAESYYALKHKNLPILSEQQLLDCTPNPHKCGGEGGCKGATVELAYNRAMEMNGLASGWTYGYNSYFGDAYKCNLTRSAPVAKITNFVNLPQNENAPILNHLLNHGPLAVSVDARGWHFYEGGVYDGCNQTVPDINHAVQLVGVGTDPKHGDYWLLRNSWTHNWGENGYIRLRRTSFKRCGIDKTPEHGDGCEGGPPEIVVCGTCGMDYNAIYPIVQ